MLLLTDGRVMIQQGWNLPDQVPNSWWVLTPDQYGSYAKGTLSKLPGTMNHSRWFYASAVLKDGRVFVAGGEYDENSVKDGKSSATLNNTAETYDPQTDTWTALPAVPSSWTQIGDAPCTVLPDGRVLIGSRQSADSIAYDPVTNTWAADASQPTGSGVTCDEQGWAMLPDHTVLTVGIYGDPNAIKKYIPGAPGQAGTWMTDAALPSGPTGFTLTGSDVDNEIGPSVLLPDGRLLWIGATGFTGLYTPSASPSGLGSWQQGPNLQFEVLDAPACLEPNGKVMCVAGPRIADSNSFPTHFYEFDPSSTPYAFVEINGPNGATPQSPLQDSTYKGRMMVLPNGQILWNSESAFALYTPSGSPSPSLAPRIQAITPNPDGTYRIHGYQLNGLSEAVGYGDDVSASTNYPLVRFTSPANQRVWYARAFNRSLTGVATGPIPETVDFEMPSGLDTGPFQVSVVANGIASTPYPWTAYRAVANATGSDGNTRILWTKPDGSAIIWNVAFNGTYASSPVFGPYTGMAATAIAQGPDNNTWVLWTGSDGTMVLWKVNNSTWSASSSQFYGPYDSGTTTAASLSVGPDGLGRILWNKQDGSCVIWTVDSTTWGTLYPPPSSPFFGPFDNGRTWAKGISVGPDNSPWLLWNRPDGSMALWELVTSNWSWYSSPVFGPYDNGGTRAVSVSIGPDGPHVLWDRYDGSAVSWLINSNAGWTFTSSPIWGPYDAGTTIAQTISMDPQNNSWILWDKPDGTSVVWIVTPPSAWTQYSTPFFGPLY